MKRCRLYPRYVAAGLAVVTAAGVAGSGTWPASASLASPAARAAAAPEASTLAPGYAQPGVLLIGN